MRKRTSASAILHEVDLTGTKRPRPNDDEHTMGREDVDHAIESKARPKSSSPLSSGTVISTATTTIVTSKRPPSAISGMTLNHFVRHVMTERPSCWVDWCPRIPAEIALDAKQFDQLWSQHPTTRSQVRMFNKLVDVPRYQQAYGADYRFSGVTHKAMPLESVPYLQRLSEWVKAQSGGLAHSQVLVNWYEDGSSYINWHADAESDLANVQLDPARINIFSFSFGAPRRFDLRSKRAFSKKKEAGNVNTFEVAKVGEKKGARVRSRKKAITAIPSEVEWVLPGNSCLVMGGEMQQYYKHQVPKMLRCKAKRINITFRVTTEDYDCDPTVIHHRGTL